jgi:hypothetical protein
LPAKQQLPGVAESGKMVFMLFYTSKKLTIAWKNYSTKIGITSKNGNFTQKPPIPQDKDNGMLLCFITSSYVMSYITMRYLIMANMSSQHDYCIIHKLTNCSSACCDCDAPDNSLHFVTLPEGM